MIDCFKQKFEFELNSKIYIVSALLDTSKLNLCYWEKFAEEYSIKALDFICSVTVDLLGKEDLLVESQKNVKDKEKKIL